MEPNQGGQQGPKAISVLSEDSAEGGLVRQLLGLPDAPYCRVAIIPHSHFRAVDLLQDDLVLINQEYGNRDYRHTLDELVSAHAALGSGHTLPKLVVLMREQNVGDHLSDMAAAVRLGVHSFTTVTDLSLKQLQQLLVDETTTQPAAVAATAPTSAPPTQTVTTPEQPVEAHPAETASPPANEIANTAFATPQSHQISIDFEHRRVHLGLRAESLLGYESSGIFTMDEWLQMIDSEGARLFESMLAGRGGEAGKSRVHCEIRALDGTYHPITITDIQFIDDDNGAIVGANAQLLLGMEPAAPTHNNNIGDIPTFVSNNEASHGLLSPASSDLSSDDEARWRDVCHSFPLTSFVIDESGRIVTVMNGDHSTANSFPEVQEGQYLADALGVETNENFASIISRVLNTGKAHQQTFNMQTTQGMRWFDSSITKLKRAQGIHRLALWTAFDITPARHAYQELLKNHDAITDMLNDAPLVFCQKDSSGRYQRVNRTFCESFNVRAEVIAGRKDEEIFAGEIQQQMMEGDRAVIDSGDETSFATTTMLNGQNCTIYWLKFPLKSHSSNSIESITAFGFIDKSGIAAKTMSPGEGETGEWPASDGGSPVGAIGQDFKAILRNIVSYTEVAMVQKQRSRKQRLVEYLNQVITASERAREMILDKESPGEQSGNPPTAVDPRTLVEEIVQMLQPTLPTSLRFQTDLKGVHGKALVNPVHFQRIVMQLLVSARDSADQNDEIMLRLGNTDFTNKQCSACRKPIDGSHISLTVETSSGNINAESLQKMIDAASRAIAEPSSGNQANSNIIVMTHESDGHVLIKLDKQTISLNLLFKRADETATAEDGEGVTAGESSVVNLETEDD